MENKSTKISEELNEIAPFLAKMERVNVFQVPTDYFSYLKEKILTQIFIEQDEKNNLQKVPEGYFDSLSDQILSKIKMQKNESASEEIKSLSPALHYLKEEQTFTVPENYFDNLSERILDRINNRRTKVVSISSVQKWQKYAAAAVVAGVIAISALLTINHKSSNNEVASKNVPGYVKEASQYQTAEELNEGISSLSDDDIVNYLQSTGNILDEETITKNLDAKDLPTPDEYLIDENALNNFLKKTSDESDKNIQ